MWAEHKQLLKLVSGQLSANGIIQLGAQYTPAHDSICRRCRLCFCPTVARSFATFVPLSVCHLVSVKWNLRGETANKSETASEGEGEKRERLAQWNSGRWTGDSGAELNLVAVMMFLLRMLRSLYFPLFPTLFARK